MTSAGLSVEVEEGDYDGLVGVMKHLMDVRDRQPTTDGMFEPLKQNIELLRSYGQEMSDEIHQQLEVCMRVREGVWCMYMRMCVYMCVMRACLAAHK